jgi:hypothetical protein
MSGRGTFPRPPRFPGNARVTFWRLNMGKGLLLWLIGIPIPIILLVWLLGGLH